MGRRPTPPSTALGIAVRQHRAGRGQEAVQAETGIPHTTLSRIERGTHRPSLDTARALARWLGWTTDQVIEAADTPVDPPEPT